MGYNAITFLTEMKEIMEKVAREKTQQREWKILKEKIADGTLKTFEGVETVRSIKKEVFICNAATRAELCYKNYNFAECDFIVSNLLKNNEVYIVTDVKLKAQFKETLEKNKIMLPQTALEIIEKDRDKKCDTLAALPPSAQLNATELKEMIKAQGVAVLALEKQIPKKPIEQSTDEKTHYKCMCGCILKTVYKDKVMGCRGHIPAFCEKCGQALDRSEEN